VSRRVGHWTPFWVTWIRNTSTHTHTHTHTHTIYLRAIWLSSPNLLLDLPSRICLFPRACHMLCPSQVLLLQGKCRGIFRFCLWNIRVRSGDLPKRMVKMTEQFLPTLLICKTILMILGCHHAAGIATQRSIIPSSTESHRIWRMNPSQELLFSLDITNQHTASMYCKFLQYSYREAGLASSAKRLGCRLDCGRIGFRLSPLVRLTQLRIQWVSMGSFCAGKVPGARIGPLICF
jgi:hypothetical protein